MSGSRGRNAATGKGNNNNNGGGGVVGSIPPASRRVVQSLKEIVNCPEAEIYTMLKECNMDPNEAVNRLLSQDPFREVKSKRDKKKENKDTTDSRSRGGSASRSSRGGNDRYGRGFPSQSASFESSTSRAKPSYRKDNGPNYTSSPSVPGFAGGSANSWPASEVPVESKITTFGASDGAPSSNPPSGFQSAWSGVPGQVSMADIVKMGRPHGRTSSNVNPPEQVTNHHHVVASKAAPTPSDLHPSQNYAAMVSEAGLKSGVVGSQRILPDDDWPQDEQPQTFSMPTVSDPPVASEPYDEPSSLSFDGKNHHFDDAQYADNEADKHGLPSSKRTQEESSAFVSNDDLYDGNSYQVDQHAFEQQASAVTTSVHHLSLSKDEEEEDSPQEADSPAVKIPEHLQIQSAECSHLSFGSFGSGINAPSSGPFVSGHGKSNVEEPSTADALPLEHIDERNQEYEEEEEEEDEEEEEEEEEEENLGPALDDNSHRLGTNPGGYDMPSASQSDALQQEAVEVSPVNQYSFPPNYTFESSQHLDPSSGHAQMGSQMQNLPPLPGLMAYSNPLSSSLLPSNVQSLRDAELNYSPFPITQSMPTKYTGNVPSMSGQANMTEAPKAVNPQQPAQNLPGSGISGGPGFPHLPMHPYSQPSLPFANMVGYPFLAQSYTYMPSAFQQPIPAAGNSTYHQSLAAALPPQYKNSMAGGGLAQSAAVPSGYGAFGGSNNVSGNFQLNPSPAAPSATSISYEDLLNPQFKDAAQLLALQQAAASRTMSGVPANTYYSLQGQSQQAAGYRQGQQQPSQHYGNLGGYPNFYHSQAQAHQAHQAQAGEHQQQMSRDGQQQQQQQKQPQQQMWQNNY